jgi:hypothetical protein
VLTSNLTHPGAFHYAHETGVWTWSEQTYALHGFAPGDVVPTLELMLMHQHPDDRAQVEAFLAEVMTSGERGSLWHRVVDAGGAVHQVVTTVAGEVDESGRLHGITGQLVDVTEEVRRVTSRHVDEALELISRSRPTIEQAKGALMVTYGIDADEAFGLLRRYSQLRNIKVRDVARMLVENLGHDGGLPSDERVALDECAQEIRRPELLENPGA